MTDKNDIEAAELEREAQKLAQDKEEIYHFYEKPAEENTEQINSGPSVPKPKVVVLDHPLKGVAIKFTDGCVDF